VLVRHPREDGDGARLINRRGVLGAILSYVRTTFTLKPHGIDFVTAITDALHRGTDDDAYTFTPLFFVSPNQQCRRSQFISTMLDLGIRSIQHILLGVNFTGAVSTKRRRTPESLALCMRAFMRVSDQAQSYLWSAKVRASRPCPDDVADPKAPKPLTGFLLGATRR